MAVALSPPAPDQLHPVAGVRLGVAQAGIRKANRKDLLVMTLSEGSSVAGVFTRNRFCAAPVVVCREHLAAGRGIRALVVNTGNANAGTGATGLADARATCRSLARLLDIDAVQVLPFSTGVIMEPLPLDRLATGLPMCVTDLREGNWLAAAEAIMTTDTVAKAASRRVEIDGRQVTVTGIAKGAGMIHPDMATMLCFMATDAGIGQPQLQSLLVDISAESFNAITVDGDTSTNDSLVVAATGKSGVRVQDGAALRALRDAMRAVAVQLAQAIIRDGEGATKFITIRVEEGRSAAECRAVAFAVAHSPLVKTAFFASDPNLGRILAAIGYSGIEDLDVDAVELYLDEVRVVSRGGRDPAYREEAGQQVMQHSEITVRIRLGRGTATATVWTCDLSHEYVTINAEYRT